MGIVVVALWSFSLGFFMADWLWRKRPKPREIEDRLLAVIQKQSATRKFVGDAPSIIWEIEFRYRGQSSWISVSDRPRLSSPTPARGEG